MVLNKAALALFGLVLARASTRMRTLVILFLSLFSFRSYAALECESRLALGQVSFDQFFAEIENKSEELAQLIKQKPVDPSRYVAVFVEIGALAKMPPQNIPDPTAFENFSRHYATKIARLNEQFVQAVKEPLAKPLAQKFVSAAEGFPPPFIIRLGVMRLAVSHSTLSKLDLSREQKGRKVGEALNIAAQETTALRHETGFWGDLFLDLHNWSYLTQPSTPALLDKVNFLLTQQMRNVDPGNLTDPELRFILDTVNLLPQDLEPKAEVQRYLASTLKLVQRHKDQLQRRQPRTLEKLKAFSDFSY